MRTAITIGLTAGLPAVILAGPEVPVRTQRDAVKLRQYAPAFSTIELWESGRGLSKSYDPRREAARAARRGIDPRLELLGIGEVDSDSHTGLLEGLISDRDALAARLVKAEEQVLSLQARIDDQTALKLSTAAAGGNPLQSPAAETPAAENPGGASAAVSSAGAGQNSIQAGAVIAGNDQGAHGGSGPTAAAEPPGPDDSRAAQESEDDGGPTLGPTLPRKRR